MASTPRAQTSRVPVAALMSSLLVLGLMLTSGCGGSASTNATGTTAASSSSLRGLVRPQPLDVASVTLPETTPGEVDRPFPMKAQPGGLLFVYFGYTNCPDLCPTTMADLRKALKQLGPDANRVSVAFVTVDPERDTAPVVSPYVTSFIAGAHALRTEDPAALKQAQDAFLASSKVTKDANGKVEVSHTAVSSIVDSNGKVVVEWPFGTSADDMANDLRILLDRQSSPGTTGTP